MVDNDIALLHGDFCCVLMVRALCNGGGNWLIAVVVSCSGMFMWLTYQCC